jgi:putative oxidoreductase
MNPGSMMNIGARMLIATVLILAGVGKVLNPALFAESVNGFRLMPWPAAAALALYVPWLELATAMGLWVPRWRAGALLLATTLFVVFSLVWAITWMRGIDANCGCFGGAGRTSASWALLRATALVCIAALALRAELRKQVAA